MIVKLNIIKKIMYFTMFFTLVFIISLEANTVYVEVPSDVTKEQVLNPDNTIRERLYNITREKLKTIPKYNYKGTSPQWKEKPFRDVIIVYTKDGKIIVPEIKKAPSLSPAEPTGEITYVLDESWTAEEKTNLQNLINTVYPMIKSIYGNPYQTKTVTIHKDPNAPYNYATATSIVLLESNSGVLVHEMVHNFTLPLIVNIHPYDEGMAEAVTKQLGYKGDYDIDPSYYLYENNNKLAMAGYFLTISWIWYVRYPTSAYVFSKLYREDNNFFINFNKNFYEQVIVNNSIQGNKTIVDGIIYSIKPTTEGISTDKWLKNQYILETNPPKGYYLYTTLEPYTDSNYVEIGLLVTYKYSYSQEIALSEIPIKWTIYDCNESILKEGMESSGPFIGGIPINLGSYKGRIKVIAECEIEGLKLIDTSYGYAGMTVNSGLFGISVYNNTGTVNIPGVGTFNLVNGGFDIPSLKTTFGPITGTFTDSTGKQTNITVTKDSSYYFHILDYSYPPTGGVTPPNIPPTNSITYQNWLKLVNNVFRPTLGQQMSILWSMVEPNEVTISIYNLKGELVKKVVNKVRYGAGLNEEYWNGKNESGDFVASGTYIILIQAGNYCDWKKAVVIK